MNISQIVIDKIRFALNDQTNMTMVTTQRSTSILGMVVEVIYTRTKTM